MEDVIKIKLLFLIKKNSSITELLKDGFTYGQIANMINELALLDFIREIEGKLTITEFAENWISKFKVVNKLKGFEFWILPEEKSKIEKFNEKDVYLPHRNELNF